MSNERTNVFGVVVITMCVTAAGLAVGWFAVSRYLGQQTISAAQEEAPAAAQKTPGKTVRVRKADNGRGGLDNQSSAGPVPASAETAAIEVSGAGESIEPTTEGQAPVPSSVAEPGSESPSVPAQAVATAEATESHTDARTIMEEAQRRSEARFYQYDGVLQSFDAKNKLTEKRWTFDRAGSNGQSKTVLRFTAPAEVKGVALLIHNHPERASDQWMWTPALQRDRRIALQDRSTRFFGTDFSFEDLEERDVDQYDYALLGTETIDGAACWKIETTPKRTRSSHYTRSVAWIRKDNYVLARLDHFVGDDVVKRLTNSTIENVQGIWTPLRLEMADLNRGTRTRLNLQQVKYNTPLRERDFTLEAIRH
jgi:outer membrane lipoprotein-sorting protein